MVVLYGNEKFELEMSFRLFENLKQTCPNKEVSVTEVTGSTYKRLKIVKIRDLEDYSKVRNGMALA
jgi:hypothetical protein